MGAQFGEILVFLQSSQKEREDQTDGRKKMLAEYRGAFDTTAFWKNSPFKGLRCLGKLVNEMRQMHPWRGSSAKLAKQVLAERRVLHAELVPSLWELCPTAAPVESNKIKVRSLLDCIRAHVRSSQQLWVHFTLPQPLGPPATPGRGDGGDLGAQARGCHPAREGFPALIP